MRVAIASNHLGVHLKQRIKVELEQHAYQIDDLGPFTDEICDYPDYAAKAAAALTNGEVDRAILIGGTGIGMSIVANKFRGVRAALCYDEITTELSRSHNDANILCLSASLLDEITAIRMVLLWLTTEFEGGRHARRTAKIDAIKPEVLSPCLDGKHQPSP